MAGFEQFDSFFRLFEVLKIFKVRGLNFFEESFDVSLVGVEGVVIWRQIMLAEGGNSGFHLATVRPQPHVVRSTQVQDFVLLVNQFVEIGHFF